MTYMVDVEGLSREFSVWARTGRFRRSAKVVEAVADVSFTVARGEAVGYVGPNGSGKSTTIKMLTGILAPSSGRVSVCGLEPSQHRKQLARRIGIVFGQRSQLWWDLPLRESLEILRAIYRIPQARFRARLDECVELLDLDSFLERPVRQLSLGQRMRGEVTAALLHDPDLLVLDEPTIGLDLESKAKLRGFLAELVARRATTLLLTTHDLQDIELLCPRLIVIDHGRILADGALDTLRDEVSPERILRVDLKQPGALLPTFHGVTTVQADEHRTRQRLSFDPRRTTAAELIAQVAQVAPVIDVSVTEPAIEDVIRGLYARSGAVPAARHISRSSETTAGEEE
ncbi:ABC-2 type transport system ATP-binding protein [Streptomyces atratus]|uniref:ABC-2 type transport system ATP-binding protein n=2 Tax=Streptomyces atratus TaxID=1893 RepID=A0A1K2FAH6_STRAR|nr:ABC-2 type transport system ATP-binding protein [Streptomyces atratus]